MRFKVNNNGILYNKHNALLCDDVRRKRYRSYIHLLTPVYIYFMEHDGGRGDLRYTINESHLTNDRARSRTLDNFNYYTGPRLWYMMDVHGAKCQWTGTNHDGSEEAEWWSHTRKEWSIRSATDGTVRKSVADQWLLTIDWLLAGGHWPSSYSVMVMLCRGREQGRDDRRTTINGDECTSGELDNAVVGSSAPNNQ